MSYLETWPFQFLILSLEFKKCVKTILVVE